MNRSELLDRARARGAAAGPVEDVAVREARMILAFAGELLRVGPRP